MYSRLPFVLVLGVLFTSLVVAQDARVPDTDLRGDPLPEGAIARLGSIRLRQGASITCLAIHPDGKTLISGSYTNKLVHWDVATGKQLREWVVGSSGVQGIHFSADGKVLAVACSDGTIRILDATGTEKKSLTDPMRRYGNLAVSLSPDGKTAIMMHRYDRQMLVFDVESGTLKHRLTGVSSYYAPQVAFTPDGKQFVTLWTDGKIHLVDAASGKSVRGLEPASIPANTSMYSSRISAMALSPDGKTLIYRTTTDRFFNFVEVATAKPIRRFERSGSYYHGSQGSMYVTPNGRFLIEAAGDNAIRVWGLASGKVLREMTSPSGSIGFVTVSRDGKTIASAYNNAIYVWDVISGIQMHKDFGHQGNVTRLVFSPDGKRVFSIGNSSMRAWEAATGKEQFVTRYVYGYSVNYLHTSPDGKAVRWLGSDRAQYQWRPGEDQAPVRLTNPRTVTYYSSQATTPDGKIMAAINHMDKKLRLVDLVGTKPDRELTILTQYYSNSLVFSPDGRLLALAAYDRSLTLYDVASGMETRKLVPDPSMTGYTNQNIVFSPDSRTLLRFDNGDLKVIETLTGNVRYSLPRETAGAPNVMTWSPDSRLIACGYSDGGLVVTDTYTGKQPLRRNGGQGALYSVAFSPDLRRVATGGANTTGLVWNLPAISKPARLPGTSEETAWNDLADADPTRGFRAMVHLIAGPTEAIRLVKDRLKPRPAPDLKRVAKLIEELDHDSYAVREKASEDLAEIGPGAEEALKKAAKSPSLEVKRRAEDLLRKLKGGAGISPDRLRTYRVVEVLERIGTPGAKDALRTILKAKVDSTLEESIKMALERMGESS